MWQLIKAQLEYFKKQILISWLLALAVCIASIIYFSNLSEINPEAIQNITLLLFLSWVPNFAIINSFATSEIREKHSNLFYSLPVKPLTAALAFFTTLFILILPSLVALSISTLSLIISGTSISLVSVATLAVLLIGAAYSNLVTYPLKFTNQLYFFIVLLLYIPVVFIFFMFPIMAEDSMIPLEAYSSPIMLFSAFLLFAVFGSAYMGIHMLRYRKRKPKYAADEIIKKDKSQSYNIATERNRMKNNNSLAFKGLAAYSWPYLIMNIVLILSLSIIDFLIRSEGESSRTITTVFMFESYFFSLMLVSYSFVRIQQEKLSKSLLATVSSPSDVLIIKYKLLSLFILPRLVLIFSAFLMQKGSGLYTNLLLEMNAFFVFFILSQLVIHTVDTLKFKSKTSHNTKIQIWIFLSAIVIAPIFISDAVFPLTINIVILLLLILFSFVVNFRNRKSYLNRESYV
jgi:hypothetical protein